MWTKNVCLVHVHDFEFRIMIDKLVSSRLFLNIVIINAWSLDNKSFFATHDIAKFRVINELTIKKMF